MVRAGLEPIGGSGVGLKGRMGPRVGPWKPVRHCPPLFHRGSKLLPVGQGPVFGHTAGRGGGQGAVGAKPGIGGAAVTAQVQGRASPRLQPPGAGQVRSPGGVQHACGVKQSAAVLIQGAGSQRVNDAVVHGQSEGVLSDLTGAQLS